MSRFKKIKLWLISLIIALIIASPVSAQQMMLPKVVPCWPTEMLLGQLQEPPYNEQPFIHWEIPGAEGKIVGMLFFNKEQGNITIVEVGVEKGIACGVSFGDNAKPLSPKATPGKKTNPS